MKNLLNPEGALFQMLSRIGDMIILNFLFLVCCIPVVTAGASMAALYKVSMDMHYDMEDGMFTGFFKAFRANFKQATVVWLVELLVLVSLACDVLLVITWFGGSTLMYVLLGILALLVLCVCAYMIPLLVRYENTLRQHLNNALVLSIVKLPKTILMVLLNALPLIIALLNMTVFIQTLIFWLFIGFSFVAYMNLSLLKKVFAQLESGNENVTVGI